MCSEPRTREEWALAPRPAPEPERVARRRQKRRKRHSRQTTIFMFFPAFVFSGCSSRISGGFKTLCCPRSSPCPLQNKGVPRRTRKSARPSGRQCSASRIISHLLWQDIARTSAAWIPKSMQRPPRQAPDAHVEKPGPGTRPRGFDRRKTVGSATDGRCCR